jgi:hypothetical protein
MNMSALRGVSASGLGVKISPDACGLSAIAAVSGTFGDKCLKEKSFLFEGGACVLRGRPGSS